MRLGRLLRRLKARWRLHRMEWNAMHRPLEPPPGYERFYTEEAVFPGLAGKWKKKESLDDYVQGFKKAWKIYRHDFVYDPEVAAMEEQFGADRQKKAERKAAVIVKRASQVVKEGVDAADEIIDEIQDKTPDAKRLLNNRVSVLAEAMNEFSQGYKDGVDGKFKFWEEEEDEEDAEDRSAIESADDVKDTERQVDSDRVKQTT